MGFVGVVPDIVPPGVFVVGEEVLLLIIIIIKPFTVLLLESFAVTVNIELVIGNVELPATAPVVAFMVKPAGSVAAAYCLYPVTLPVGVELYTVVPITPLIGI